MSARVKLLGSEMPAVVLHAAAPRISEGVRIDASPAEQQSRKQTVLERPLRATREKSFHSRIG